jgi:hypothetical protein
MAFVSPRRRRSAGRIASPPAPTRTGAMKVYETDEQLVVLRAVEAGEI